MFALIIFVFIWSSFAEHSFILGLSNLRVVKGAIEEVDVESGGLGGRVICARVVLKGKVGFGECLFSQLFSRRGSH